MNNETDNQLGAEGAKAINEAMKINTTLTSLDLRGDDIILKERNRKKSKKKKMNNEQGTKQDQKEQKQ